MRRIRLTTAEQEQLEPIFKTTNDRRLRDRCQAVLMASRGAEAQDHCPRFRGASHHGAALAPALSRTGRAGRAEPVGPRPTETDARDVGADNPGVGESRPCGVWARSRELDLRRAGNVCVSELAVSAQDSRKSQQHCTSPRRTLTPGLCAPEDDSAAPRLAPPVGRAKRAAPCGTRLHRLLLAYSSQKGGPLDD